MSVQPPVTPHRISIVDFEIPFWRMVMLIIKWTFAAIPAMIIISILLAIIGAVFGGIIAAIVGHVPGVRL